MKWIALMVAYVAVATAAPTVDLTATITTDQTPPHLSQAWQAMSTGDGLPGATGMESYLYEDCKDKSDTCMNGHVFNYGADNCIKYEVDRGFHSAFSGTYYVKCDAVDCCTAGQIPSVKKWDVGQAGKILQDQVTYLGKRDITALNNETVKGADAWFEEFNIPLTRGKIKANYTYYVTTKGSDVITHRIEYGVSGQTAGVILYGDFEVQHNLTSFRSVFEPPAACLKPNTVKCSDAQMEKWDNKYFNKAAIPAEPAPLAPPPAAAAAPGLTLTLDPAFLKAKADVGDATHYGDPSAGCETDEVSVQIQGITGDFCTSKCSLFKACPTDVPSGVTATPQCALSDASSGAKYCALICDPSGTNTCGSATCKSISGTGVCTYDD